MAVWLSVQCPHYHSEEVIKNGKSAEGKQRYRCQNKNCPYRTFILDQTYPGRTRQVGSAKQVMMHCSSGRNTKWHQCDSPTTWKKTRFFVPTEIPVVSTCCWIAQHSSFCLSLFPPLDVACLAELLHRLPKNRCKQPRIGDKPQARNSTIDAQRLRLVRQCKRQQFHECRHRAPTRPTACCLCGLQMTTTRRIEWWASPFFGCHLHTSRHLGIFLVDVGLQPLLRNLHSTGNSSEGNPF